MCIEKENILASRLSNEEHWNYWKYVKSFSEEMYKVTCVVMNSNRFAIMSIKLLNWIENSI